MTERPHKGAPEATYAAEWRRLDETLAHMGQAHAKMLEEHEQEVERLRTALKRAEQASFKDRDIARLMAQRISGSSARIVEADVRAIIMLLACAEAQQTGLDLVSSLGLPQSTTSDWLEQAIKRGWLTRTPSTKDKRVSVFKVTPRGLRSLRKAQRQDADMSPEEGAEE